MTLTAFQCVIWIAGFAVHALLAIVMLRRGSYRRWPSLFSLAIYGIVLDVIVSATAAHHYEFYFCAYWGGAVLRAFLGLWLVFDIIKALPNIQYTPRALAIGFLSLATALAIGSAWMASSGGTQTFHLTMMAFTLARCIAVIWGVFAITLFWGIGFCGWGWTPTPLRMAASFLVLVLILSAQAYAMSRWPNSSTKISNISNFCTLGIWLSWSLIMRKEHSALKGVIALPPQPHIERGSGV